MNFIVYIVPFLAAMILFLFFRKKVVWWEYMVLIIPSLLFTLLVKLIMVSCNASDIEYLGGYVTKITYYEDWDELVQVRHEERVRTGTDSQGNPTYTTRVWYTTERRYHPEKWTCMVNDDNYEMHIKKELYNKIKTRFNTKPIFKDMHRKYHRKDGDAYVTIYDGSIDHIYDITIEHRYKNKIQASQSRTIFKMIDIDEKTADSLKLYKYPDIEDLTQNPILGKNATKDELQVFRYINAMKGKKNQFRTYVLFFNYDEFEKSELQKAYWQNGNKNEFIVSLGMKGDSVVWTNCFSWCDVPKLEIMTKNYFINNPKLNLKSYGSWLNNQIDESWVRKEFDDFNYIDIELSGGQYVWLFILTVLVNIGVSLIVIYNNINVEELEFGPDPLNFLKYKK